MSCVLKRRRGRRDGWREGGGGMEGRREGWRDGGRKEGWRDEMSMCLLVLLHDQRYVVCGMCYGFRAMSYGFVL